MGNFTNTDEHSGFFLPVSPVTILTISTLTVTTLRINRTMHGVSSGLLGSLRIGSVGRW